MLERLNPKDVQVFVGTDSHTSTEGTIPVLALPIGTAQLAVALYKGKLLYSIPPVFRIDFSEKLPPGITLRDALLEITATVKPLETGMVIEYGGSGLNGLTFDQVAAACNIVPDIFKAETAVTEPFAAGIRYLQEKFGISENDAIELYGTPQKGCDYAQSFEYNLSRAVPRIALPGGPDKTVSLAGLTEHPAIQKAYLVSCTLGLEDLIQAAAVLKDHQIASGVRLIIAPSSDAIRQQAETLGIMNIFRNSGAEIAPESACGACIGEGGGAVEAGETAITASPRNIHGRMGSREADVYMGSAILTALAAINGQIPTAENYRSESARIQENLEVFV